MNTDFRLSVGIFEHPKIIKLRRRLGSDGFVGYLQLLRFVTQNRPTGILSGMDAEDIAIAGGYDDAETFRSTLLELRLIDQVGDHYCIHDWNDHNPWAASSPERSERSRHASRARWDKTKGIRAQNDAQAVSSGCADDATRINPQCDPHQSGIAPSFPFPPSPLPSLPKLVTSAGVPNTVAKNSDKPVAEQHFDHPSGDPVCALPPDPSFSPEEKHPPRKNPDPPGDASLFATIWQVYPRRENRQGALRAWAKLRPDDALQAEILARIRLLLERPAWTTARYSADGRDTVPHLATWLNARRWEDELAAAGSEQARKPRGETIAEGALKIDDLREDIRRRNEAAEAVMQERYRAKAISAGARPALIASEVRV